MENEHIDLADAIASVTHPQDCMEDVIDKVVVAAFKWHESEIAELKAKVAELESGWVSDGSWYPEPNEVVMTKANATWSEDEQVWMQSDVMEWARIKS